MCCRTVVEPLDPTIARVILTVGQFVPQGDPAAAVTWRREVPEEGCNVTVTLAGNEFQASITPSISHYTHHAGKRVTGGIYFEICAKYAEKVDGTVTQKSNVQGCADPDTHFSQHVLAVYPHMPLSWDRACNGFQSVILGHDHDHDAA